VVVITDGYLRAPIDFDRACRLVVRLGQVALADVLRTIANDQLITSVPRRSTRSRACRMLSSLPKDILTLTIARDASQALALNASIIAAE
jgi:hypothetical protein